jgi:hypothetical protein
MYGIGRMSRFRHGPRHPEHLEAEAVPDRAVGGLTSGGAEIDH